MLGACSCSGGPNAVSSPAPVAVVTVTPAMAPVGIAQTLQLLATTKDSAGNVLTGRVVTWASRNTVVATVSSTGLVTGVKAGQATISATSEERDGAATITVEHTTASLAFATVSPGTRHSCGRTTIGAGYCWGSNSTGQLGNGATTNSATPVAVSTGLGFANVSAGDLHTCAVALSGAAYCWGSNASGQLGDGATTASATPMAVLGGLTLTTVSAGNLHTCGVNTEGDAYCWGSNERGQLGNGTTNSSSIPLIIAEPRGGLGEFIAEASAGGLHNCGPVNSFANGFCWGSNDFGQLGNGTTSSSSTPVAVTGGLTFAVISAGGSHTCGVTGGGDAYCWGNNGSGQLGNGTTTNSAEPVEVDSQP